MSLEQWFYISIIVFAVGYLIPKLKFKSAVETGVVVQTVAAIGIVVFGVLLLI